ncbi:MAG: hypothetical protein IH846_15150 [Acidobacteria bacterium]|nr:hypothetical protein [Acidobacteriota bacterium]
MADGIRLDLQEALARGPSGIPNLEPLFAPGSIPPIFSEPPELDEGAFIPSGGIPPSGATATFPGEPIDIGNAPIGSPVPPARRENRIRALLGDFLSNFGAGLLASARAPSGSEFAASIGGALSEPAERRRQQVFADLHTANQKFRQQEIALRQARLDQQAAQFEQTFEFTKTQAKRPRTFEAFAVNLLQAGDEAGARRILDLARGNPQGRLITRQAGQDLVGLDPTTLEEVTRLPDFFPSEVKPPTFAERRQAQRQRVNTMAAAFLVQTGGNARAAAKLLREKLQEDPKGFAAKNFSQVMQAIRSGDLSNATEILLNALREQQQR